MPHDGGRCRFEAPEMQCDAGMQGLSALMAAPFWRVSLELIVRCAVNSESLVSPKRHEGAGKIKLCWIQLRRPAVLFRAEHETSRGPDPTSISSAFIS